MFDTLRDNSRIIVYIVVVAFVISGGFMGYGAYLNNQGGGGQAPNQNSSIIAEVNGIEISQQEYFSLLQQQVPQSNLSSAQITPFKYNVLNALIERKLVLAKAEELGVEVEVSESEIDDRYNDILDQRDMNDQELADDLAEQGATIGELREGIKSSIKDSKTINQAINQGIGEIEVSEQEIQELYEQRYPEQTPAESNSEANTADTSEKNSKPELKEVEEELEKEINNQKRNEAINTWVSELKDEAEIIINDPILSAYHALETENYNQAVDEFSSFVEQEETNPIFYSYLAQAYQGQNNYDQAEKVYNKAVEAYPENNNLRFNFARFLADQDKTENALAQLDEISATSENDYRTYYQLFMMYQQLGAEEKAQSAMEEIQQISENMQQNQQNQKVEEKSDEDIEKESEELNKNLEVETPLETEDNE